MTDRFEVRELDSGRELAACVALQRETWGDHFTELVPATMLRIAQRTGGVVAGAFDRDGSMAGFVFGLTGVEDDRWVHWSDMLAVRVELRNRGLGERLKRFQRQLLLPIGVETVYWTFDPLESKNAYLNFARLGVTVREYLVNMYGDTDSPLHRGIGTDRVLAVWRIAGERVRRRLDGVEPAPTAAAVAELPLVNRTSGDPARLEPGEPALDLDAPAVRVAIPLDIQALKSGSQELAAEWRRVTRAALQAYLDRGYRIVELVREADRSCYVLARDAFF